MNGLRGRGLPPDEIKQVELIVVPPVNTEQALRQGQIDVATLGSVFRDSALETWWPSRAVHGRIVVRLVHLRHVGVP